MLATIKLDNVTVEPPYHRLFTELPSFEPLYHGDKLHVVNVKGTIGIVTLWTPVETVLEAIKGFPQADLDKIAVVANLYGDGFIQMTRNLLWNPQISNLFILGQDLSGTAQDLENFLSLGVEEAEQFGELNQRIIGTNRFLDRECNYNEYFLGKYRYDIAGAPSPVVFSRLQNFLSMVPATPIKATHPSRKKEYTRVFVPVLKYKPKYYPSNILDHSVVGDSPLDAWEELVCRIMRFGIPSIASKTKNRLELINLKAVIMKPRNEAVSHLGVYGYNLEDLKDYQVSFMDPNNKGSNYTYGERIYNQEQLENVIANLKKDLTTRNGFLSLWTPQDIKDGDSKSVPCLVSIFFRYVMNKLHMTATFRAHNTMSAWIKNAYGLMYLQRHVATILNVEVGPLTIFSQSISIDPTVLDKVKLAQRMLASRKDGKKVNRVTGKREMKNDPNGYFVFSLDKDTKEIVAKHVFEGNQLTEYRGRSAIAVENQLLRDFCISEISHALYVGRELAKLESELKHIDNKGLEICYCAQRVKAAKERAAQELQLQGEMQEEKES